MPNNLSVPHITQGIDALCLPTCVAMVLAYWESPVTVGRIAQLFDSTPYGTPTSRCQRLTNWGWRVIHQPTTLQTIQYHLAQNTPVIVSLRTGFIDYWKQDMAHVVVVVGMDNEALYLNDPSFDIAPQRSSIDGFLAAWIEQDEIAIVIEKAT